MHSSMKKSNSWVSAKFLRLVMDEVDILCEDKFQDITSFQDFIRLLWNVRVGNKESKCEGSQLQKVTRYLRYYCYDRRCGRKTYG